MLYVLMVCMASGFLLVLASILKTDSILIECMPTHVKGIDSIQHQEHHRYLPCPLPAWAYILPLLCVFEEIIKRPEDMHP